MDKFWYRASVYGWDSYCLEQGDVSLAVVPQLGGRIVSLQYRGEELFFVNERHMGETFTFGGVSTLKEEKQRIGNRLWGGDKTWVAPENDWLLDIPPLELDAGKYTFDLEDRAIRMQSLVDRETGLQVVRRILLGEQAEIVLEQTFVNMSDCPVRCAIWNVTQMKRPFVVYMPIAEHFVKPDLRFSASSKWRDQQVQEEAGWTRVVCDRALQFKYGAKLDHGIALAVRHTESKTLAMLREFAIDAEAVYPNDNMVEVYNASAYDYFEFEVLAPLKLLQPGESTDHRQIWRLQEFDGRCTIGEVMCGFDAIV